MPRCCRREKILCPDAHVSLAFGHTLHKPHMELFINSLVVVVNEAYIFASKWSTGFQSVKYFYVQTHVRIWNYIYMSLFRVILY